MAITYLSGQRVQGSSTATSTPTYSGDFGTWATTGSQVTESSDVVSFAITTRIANHTVTNDLGSALSNSEWVMRCKLEFTTLTAGGGSTIYFELGVGSANSSSFPENSGVSFDLIALQSRIGSGGGDTGWGCVGYNSTGALNNPESPTMDTVATTQIYYVEIKRLSTTSMSIGLYDSADFDSLIMPIETKTIDVGVTGLQYLRVGNGGVGSESSTGNVNTGTVRDFQIWNATTSATQDDKDSVTDVPVGSEFEQTNDYKSYQFGVSTGTTNQSTKDDVSGIDANQAEGGWGVKLFGSHTLVGKKITSITTNMKQNASGYTEQTITLKHYGSSSATLRATGSTMSSDDLTGSFLSKTFTFSNPVTVQAGDYILFTIPADMGTSGAWACEIEDGSPESNAYFVTWADGGSFYDQTGRALYYSTTYESDPAWVERGTAI